MTLNGAVLMIPTVTATASEYLFSVFTAKVLQNEASYRVCVSDRWLVDVVEIRGIEQGMFYSRRDAAQSLFVMDAALALVSLENGYLQTFVAGPNDTLVAASLEKIKAAYPVAQLPIGPQVPMVFWAAGEHGPLSWRRDVVVPTWSTVAGNYAPPSRGLLDNLCQWKHPPLQGGGQLVFWHGPPGTGKTWAIRALASEWREWCQFEYVTDPDKLFGDAAYLTQVLLEHQDEARPPWRCLILEDTGELLAADAKTREGQSLSRLLNVVDGFLGQGLQILLLITTNEDVKTLHPAVIRPGRCLYRVVFTNFSGSNMQHWLHQHRCTELERSSATLAELYQHLEFPLVPFTATTAKAGF